MKRYMCVFLMLLFVAASSCVYASSYLIPTQDTTNRASDLYINCDFVQTDEEAMKGVTSVAVDTNGWIYILKSISSNGKQVDIYRDTGTYYSGVIFNTDSSCGLLQIDGQVYLYYVRGQFAFLFSNGQLTDDLFYFNDPSGRYAYSNYTSAAREFEKGMVIASSGNSFLKLFGCLSVVELNLSNGITRVFDATTQCTSQLAAMSILVICLICVFIIGLWHRFHQGTRKTADGNLS